MDEKFSKGCETSEGRNHTSQCDTCNITLPEKSDIIKFYHMRQSASHTIHRLFYDES
jgi:hypothetical protein